MIGRSRTIDRLTSVIERLSRGDLTATATESDGPGEVRTLARSINSLGNRARSEAAVEREAELFRQRCRLISATIRRTSNANQMAEYLVRGVGQAFEADRVWLQTFADERVPAVASQWHQERLAPFPTALGHHVEAARTLADRLWQTADIIVIEDQRNYEPTPAGAASHAIARDLGTTASIVAPIGDGSSAFGILWISMADHSRRWSHTECGVALHLATDLAHSLVQAHTISQQAEAVRMLRELDQAKADFISTVSHELRTPLTTITGYLEILQDGEAGPLPAAALEALSIIDRNAVRLRNLIEDLLTQSRIDAGRLRLDIASVALGSLLGDVRASLLPMATSASVTVKPPVGPYSPHMRDDGPVGPVIQGDPHQLEQVFTNLLSNAIKFSRPGGTVSLNYGCDEDGDGVFIQVADTGIGIPEHDIARLFDRFFRASNATAAALPGTGLGLAIVREIVHRHGGAVDAESTLDAGTTLTVWLPLRLPPQLASES
ncbi:MAG: multi-sensor signal transduction histidine kinase [Frankiales bacterium]|nr:multi-sensor signal transduction histidine kinase [Frankiales bacterium]